MLLISAPYDFTPPQGAIAQVFQSFANHSTVDPLVLYGPDPQQQGWDIPFVEQIADVVKANYAAKKDQHVVIRQAAPSTGSSLMIPQTSGASPVQSPPMRITGSKGRNRQLPIDYDYPPSSMALPSNLPRALVPSFSSNSSRLGHGTESRGQIPVVSNVSTVAPQSIAGSFDSRASVESLRVPLSYASDSGNTPGLRRMLD